MSELIAAAEQQLARLPAHERQPNWPGSLTRLDEARTGLEAAYADWKAARDALPPSSIPGTDAGDEVLADRNAEAWSYLCDWADTGHVLTDIDTAATRARNRTAPLPQTPARPHPRRPR
jgi:hypothetical protein